MGNDPLGPPPTDPLGIPKAAPDISAGHDGSGVEKLLAEQLELTREIRNMLWWTLIGIPAFSFLLFTFIAFLAASER